MTNEELCREIQEGRQEYIPVLWGQVSDFVAWRAHKYLTEYPEHLQQLKDDMINQSYFHFLKAVEAYDPEQGAFTSYLSWHIRNAFTEVLQGGRSERLKQDPVNTAISIDTPISDTEDLTLAELLTDESAEAPHRAIEDRAFWDSVGAFLIDCLDRVRDRQGAEIIRYMYIHGGTVKGAATAVQGAFSPAVYDHYRTAMKQLKKRMTYSVERERMQSIGLDEYIYTWGVQGWKNRRFTSSTEYSAMKRIEHSKGMLLSDVKNAKQYDDILSLLGR